MQPRRLKISVNDGEFVFSAQFSEKNPAVRSGLLAGMPLETMFTHAVISGQTITANTKLVFTGPLERVKREVGSIYFYAPSCCIAMCYGGITESALVSEIARAEGPDLEILKKVGQLVWDKTYVNPKKTIVPVQFTVEE